MKYTENQKQQLQKHGLNEFLEKTISIIYGTRL